jgi:2-oxoglutarate ferredoxin oxidoreductase subunit alpha
MQLAGTQFTMENALAGSDLATFPDYPAEIRAPVGTTYGVSSFQIHFGAVDVKTAGDELDVLVALNPAALKVNLGDLRIGGTVVVDTGSFTDRNLGKAGYDGSPLEDDTLAPYQVIQLDIGQLTRNAVEHLGLSSRDALRSRNMWALGLLLWMFDRDKLATVEWLRNKFKDAASAADAAVATLSAGHAFGETVEMPTKIPGYTVSRAELEPGLYRTVSGTDALAWGLVSGLKSSGLARMVFASYPITPASPLLHMLARMKELGVVTFQAEDEIAAACAAIGASYAGSLGVTSSSGPGIALKTEAIGLAVATELPLIIVNSQRGGPSTGLPTKTEQADLFQRSLDTGGLLSRGPRSRPPRHPLHDAGLRPHGRVPGECGRAMADPRPRFAGRFPGGDATRPGRFPALRQRRGHPGPSVGRTRDSGAGTPDRRNRAGLGDGQHLVRP